MDHVIKERDPAKHVHDFCKTVLCIFKHGQRHHGNTQCAGIVQQ